MPESTLLLPRFQLQPFQLVTERLIATVPWIIPSQTGPNQFPVNQLAPAGDKRNDTVVPVDILFFHTNDLTQGEAAGELFGLVAVGLVVLRGIYAIEPYLVDPPLTFHLETVPIDHLHHGPFPGSSMPMKEHH